MEKSIPWTERREYHLNRAEIRAHVLNHLHACDLEITFREGLDQSEGDEPNEVQFQATTAILTAQTAHAYAQLGLLYPED